MVQGVTEVLPISSSAHLILIPWFWGFTDPGLAFDVALHIGTLIALIAFFYTDWLKIIKGFFSGIKKQQFKKPDEKLSLFIILATIPGVLAGYFLNDLAEESFRSPLLIALMLIFFGYVMILAEKYNDLPLSSRVSVGGSLKNKRKGFLHSLFHNVGRNDKGVKKMDGKDKKMKDLTARSSLITGVAQAVAIIPGVSRSGITISAGMFQGFTREAAARFSFLISAPIILGAGVYEMRKIPFDDFSSDIFWTGLISSVIASFVTIRFLMKFVKSHKLNIFAYYRFVLAGVILLIYIFGT